MGKSKWRKRTWSTEIHERRQKHDRIKLQAPGHTRQIGAQGVDPTTAWNFAGRHLKGDRWNASKSTKRGASALLDNKETKRQRLFADMSTELKKYRARYGNLDPKHK